MTSDREDAISGSDSQLTVAIDARTGDVDAKNTQIGTAVSNRTAEVLSLNTKLGVETDFRTGNVKSLADLIGSENVYAARYTLDSNSGDSTFTADWNGEFLPDTDPVVCAMLRGTSSDDPILAVMISGANTNLKTGAHFAFSDELPNNNYELEVLVSKLP